MTRPLPWDQARRGAVIAPNWIGDAVMCLPALAALRAAVPACSLALYARAGVAPVFFHARLPAPAGDEAARPLAAEFDVVALAAGSAGGLRAARRAAPALDFVLIFPNSFYSAALARALGAPRRVGYARDGRSWLLTEALKRPRRGETPSHESFYYLELLRRAGLIAALPEAPVARMEAPPDRVAAWRRRLAGADLGGDAADRCVAIHAGASFGAAKRWLPERFAAVAADFAGQGRQVVLVGAPDERAAAAEVRRQALALGAPPDAIVNLAGGTQLEDLLAVLELSSLLIANDSGPMHLAAALGTPVVAIFGPTNAAETYPLARANALALVRAPRIPCSPCKLRACPIDHRCMTRIGAAEVAAAGRALLGAAAEPSKTTG